MTAAPRDCALAPADRRGGHRTTGFSHGGFGSPV